MGHPITLTVSPGRSGTTSLYHTFVERFGESALIGHESLHAEISKPATYHRSWEPERQREMLAEPMIARLIEHWLEAAETGPVIDFGWTVRSMIPALHDMLGDRLRVLVVHRHPMAAAASHCSLGFYSRWKDRNYCIDPWHDGVLYPQFRERWGAMSPLEKNLYRWLEITASGLELTAKLPDTPVKVITSTEIFTDPQAPRAIADFVGLPAGDVELANRRNIIEPRHCEWRPIGDEWRRIHEHSEIVSLADRLGYDLSDHELERQVAKYRFPGGVLPTIRRATRYWDVRWILGTALRRTGLRKPLHGDAQLRAQKRGDLYLTR